jgi:S1-C subfamily serine protease
LNMLAKKGLLRQAVEAAREEFGDNPDGEFLAKLLTQQPAPVSAQPRGKNLAPTFDDNITIPEALLFLQDLTMPVGSVPDLIATLTKMIAIAPAICLLRAQNVFGEFYGTGFRISDDLVLTNHHVLFPKGTVATKVQADFGFDVNRDGTGTPVDSLLGEPGTIQGEPADDWAIVKVTQMKPEWPVVSLADTPTPKVGDNAYILQHPRGQRKRLGFVRNTISEITDGVLHYLTDTEPGSSGAPVFDQQGRLIALHHAGGRRAEVEGMPPIAKNEGIRINRVFERLTAGNILH